MFEPSVDLDADKKDNCIPRFFIQKVLDKSETKEQGVNVWKDAVYVEILIPNSRDTWSGPADENHFRRWPRHYEAFQRGQEMPVDGTPLEVWPGITPAVVENLKRANVRTVEALAEMAETNVQRFGPDMLRLIQRARQYVAAKDQTADAGRLVTENSRLSAELKTAQARIESLEAELKSHKTKKKT